MMHVDFASSWELSGIAYILELVFPILLSICFLKNWENFLIILLNIINLLLFFLVDFFKENKFLI